MSQGDKCAAWHRLEHIPYRGSTVSVGYQATYTSSFLNSEQFWTKVKTVSVLKSKRDIVGVEEYLF
jgi:hypothetical protein